MKRKQKQTEATAWSILRPNMFSVTLTFLFLAFIAGTTLMPFFTLEDVASKLPGEAGFRTLEAIFFSAGVFIFASVVAFELRKQHGSNKF